MELEAYKKCPKCGCIAYGNVKVGNDSWVYCAKCISVYEIL